jgi:hypothetical protein
MLPTGLVTAIVACVCFWRNSPTRTRAASCSRFLDHTQWHTTVGRIPLDEESACRRELYLKTHSTHKRQSPMPSAGFEPAIPVSDSCICSDMKCSYAIWRVNRCQGRSLTALTCFPATMKGNHTIVHSGLPSLEVFVLCFLFSYFWSRDICSLFPVMDYSRTVRKNKLTFHKSWQIILRGSLSLFLNTCTKDPDCYLVLKRGKTCLT